MAVELLPKISFFPFEFMTPTSATSSDFDGFKKAAITIINHAFKDWINPTWTDWSDYEAGYEEIPSGWKPSHKEIIEEFVYGDLFEWCMAVLYDGVDLEWAREQMVRQLEATPFVGQVRPASAVGYKGNDLMIYAKCTKCHKPRWVKYRKQQPYHPYCIHCIAAVARKARKQKLSMSLEKCLT